VWSDPDIETVQPGIYRIPLPLPSHPGLRAVNVYALEQDNGGLTLVDSGMDEDASRHSLEVGLRQIGCTLRDVRQIIVTHVHYDHLGQATAIRRETGARVWLGLGERQSFEQLAFRPLEFPVLRTAWMERCGAHELVIDLETDPEAAAKIVDWDSPTDWITDGQLIRCGDRSLEAHATPGHTRGHFAFLDAGSRLLFPGDHVLPHISPSIGFESQRSPTALADFLSSLARVRNLPVDMILPAHGQVFSDLAGRVDELVAHHQSRLDESLAALPTGGGTAYDVARKIPWTRRGVAYETLRRGDQVLAVWETGAHLEFLESQHRLTRTSSGGVDRYTRIA
jgi:glyoxylase-like metal-dependent hydrolase (beta-lactamase superfamily II)